MTNKKLNIIGVKIKNFKSFREFPENEEYLEIKDFTTIIGKNDVGKSNLLEAIKVILENERISNDDLHKRVPSDCEISLFVETNDEFKREFDIREDVIELKLIFKWDDKNNKPKNGFYSLVSEGNERKVKYSDIEPFLPKPIFIPAVKNVEDELKFTKGSLISEIFMPIIEKTSEEKQESENVHILKTRLREAIKRESKEIKNQLLEKLREMWEDIDDISIDIPEIKLEKAITPIIKVRDKHLGKEILVSSKGSGVQRYFILALLEVYRKLKIGEGYLLLVEEPEIYLHVGAQKKLLNILKNISNRAQVIISTHSQIFVNRSDLYATYLLIKENGETKVKKFEGDREILEELGISPSDLFLTNGIILVEGPSDAGILKTFAEAIFKNWDEYNVAIIPIGGSNIDHQKPTTLLSINPNITVILDSDIKSESSNLSPKKENLKRKFESAGIKVYFWKKNGKYVRTLENLFTKEAVERALDILLDDEMNPYEDVSLKIGRKLAEKKAKHDPHFDREKINDDEFCRKMYEKTKHGKKIAVKMVEIDQVPKDIESTLNEILSNFGIKH